MYTDIVATEALCLRSSLVVYPLTLISDAVPKSVSAAML